MTRIKTRNAGSAIIVAAACAFLTATPMVAQSSKPTVHFVLWNSGPGQSFDANTWITALAPLSLTNDYIAYSTTDGSQIPDVMATAKKEPMDGTVIVLNTLQIPASDPSEFADFMRKVDGLVDTDPAFQGGITLLDQPLCRVMHIPLRPTEYTPVGMVLTTQDPDQISECYRAAAALHFRRSEGYDLGPDGTRTPAVDETATYAQNAMPPASLLGWIFLDTTDPEGKKKRESNVFVPNEEIKISASLDYITKLNAGYPGASFRIRLDLEVLDAADGTLLTRVDDLNTYQGEVRHRVPVDADYFRNWMTAGISLPDLGDYELAFIFTDLNADVEKQIPVRVETEVKIK